MRRRWHVISELVNSGGLRAGAEIGVADGRMAAEVLKSTSAHLHCVDNWAEGYQTWHGTQWTKLQQSKNRAAFDAVLHVFPGRVTLHDMTSVKASDEILDASLDWVFIDADHSYEAVKSDIAAWRPKVRRGGWLTGHDYNRELFPGVVRAVDESLTEFQICDDYVWKAKA